MVSTALSTYYGGAS